MTAQRTRAEVLGVIRETLVELVGLDPATVTGPSRLREDLDLDSIDAVDLAVKIEEMTGATIDEEALRGLRVIDDVLNLVMERLEGA